MGLMDNDQKKYDLKFWLFFLLQVAPSESSFELEPVGRHGSKKRL